jgi:hypothetical protein
MRKILLKILLCFCLLFIIAGFINRYILTLPVFQTKAGIKITSNPEAEALIDGESKGKTPFQNENMLAGDYQVRLISGNKSWQGEVKLNEGTVTTINRDLAETQSSSSGEVLILEKGKGVIVTSNPGNANISVDGIDVGQTPISLPDMKDGEHTFNISYQGYLPRSVKAVTPPGYLLQIHTDLMLTKFTQDVSPTPNIIMPVKLRVTQTPLGFVRVREKPSVSSLEIAQLTEGAEVDLVEDAGSWYKIKLQNGSIGYVNSSLVQKVSQ